MAFIQKNREGLILVAAGLLAGAIFILDICVPLGVAGGVLHVSVILMGWWLNRTRYIFALALLSTTLTGLGYVFSPEGGIDWMVVTNRLLAVFAIWTVAFLLALAKQAIMMDRLSFANLQSETTIRQEIEKELQISHAELEHRVEERTRQLQQEITERKQTESELRQFKSTLDQTQDCVFIFDPDSLRFSYVNKGAINQVGYTEAELLEMTALDIKPEFTRESFLAHIEPLLNGETSSNVFETVHRHKDGTRIPVEIILQHIAPKGEDPRFVAVVRDITERKKTQANLLESEMKHRNLIEGSIQGIAIIQNLKLMFANQALADIYGYQSTGQIVGKNTLDMFIAPQERERIQDLHRARLRGEKVPDRYEFQGMKVDGTLIWLEGLAKMVEWDGQPAAQVTYIDITERKGLQEQLLQSQKLEAIGQLAGGVAHEFNNTLQVIQGYTGIAIADPDLPPKIVQNLNNVQKATDRAASLTQQLLAFGRKNTLSFNFFDLGELLNKQMTLLRQLISEDIEIEIENEIENGSIKGDAGMLEQVFLNLCINARDAMPSGGKITIQVRKFVADPEFLLTHSWAQLETYGLVTVRDNGIGMPPEVLSHVFEPFYTTKEVGKGSGLGLSVAYGIIQQHSGMIEVESLPGERTIFSVYIPLSSEKSHQPEHPEEKTISGGEETVLVVEDEIEVLNLVTEILEDKGYTVRKAENGEDGFERFLEIKNTVNLALIDLVMPKMGGWELYQKLQAIQPGLPVIFCTGYDANSLDKTEVEQNQIMVLQKPYLPSQLTQAVREILDSAQKARS